MTAPSGGFRIGQAAAAAGVTTRTLRYYEQRGLLLPSSHSPGGERRYSREDVERLQMIRQLVDDLGTDLDSVRVLLDAEDRLGGIRVEFRRPGQTRDRQLELLSEAESVNADLQRRVSARLDGLRRVQAHLKAKAARYEDVRATLTTESSAPGRRVIRMPDVAITGSTGRLGGRVARALSDRRVKQRLVVRDPSRAPQLPGAEVVQASYGDGEASLGALQGVSTALMVSASESLERVSDHRTFIDAAAGAGVKHLVYVSFLGARPDSTFTLARDHAATERHVRESGLSFTFLRDSLYADFLPGLVGHDGTIRGPAGEGRVSAVSQQDIADAAVAVLTAPGDHAGRTYDLTGPQALSFDEIARAITDATGRAITYARETVDEAYASRAHYGAPAWEVDAWVSTYTAIAAGEVAAVSDAIPLLTGHPATTLAEVLRQQS